MVAADLALFRSFPALRSRLARRAFLAGPTPVTPFPLEGFSEGELFVKRDERSSALYGGNKPRKLEFVIGRALARKRRRLVTSGGLGTHHGLATSILGREAGLETTLVLVDQVVTPEVREALLLHAAWGAELVYGRNLAGAVFETARVLSRSALAGERPGLVLPGGSDTRGNLGFVSAGLELAEQVRAGVVPAPAEIFVPIGSGGTISGLVAGLKLAGLRARVRGVLVSDILPPSPRRLAWAARAALRALRRLAPEIPPVSISARDFPLIREQLGDGYGIPTAAARAAVAAAKEHGIGLELTYSGKCLAAIQERRRRGERSGGPILFWNTYNGVDIRARAPTVPSPERLPRRLQGLLV